MCELRDSHSFGHIHTVSFLATVCSQALLGYQRTRAAKNLHRSKRLKHKGCNPRIAGMGMELRQVLQITVIGGFIISVVLLSQQALFAVDAYARERRELIDPPAKHVVQLTEGEKVTSNKKNQANVDFKKSVLQRLSEEVLEDPPKSNVKYVTGIEAGVRALTAPTKPKVSQNNLREELERF